MNSILLNETKGENFSHVSNEKPDMEIDIPNFSDSLLSWLARLLIFVWFHLYRGGRFHVF